MPYPINLIPIPIGYVWMIVGMNWLSRFGVMMDCEGQRVVVRTPSGGELVIYGEGTWVGSRFCSKSRAQIYIQHGFADYLAYLVDTQVGERVSVSNVPVIREFADVFLEELPGVPPEKQVEFKFDLVSGATPISKAPYRLAPPEMQELPNLLQELLGEQFITPSISP